MRPNLTNRVLWSIMKKKFRELAPTLLKCSTENQSQQHFKPIFLSRSFNFLFYFMFPDCTSSSCERESKDFALDDAQDSSAFGKDNFRSILTTSKRDCSSPMCWFRPGRRSSDRNVPDGKEDSDQSCKSPMCWFRGKKRSSKMDGGEGKRRQQMLKKFLQGIKTLKNKNTRQVSEDGCESPMCWFRPGREAEDLENKKVPKYAREIHAIKEFMRREAARRFHLKATDKMLSKRGMTDDEIKY